MASRVVPATSLTMTRCSPRIRLARLDLPTLGLPMMATLMTSLLLLLVRPPGGSIADAGVQQVAGAVAVDGGDGDGVAQAQVVELIEIRVHARRWSRILLTASTMGLLAAQQHTGHLLIGGGQAGFDVRDHDDDVGVVNGDLRLLGA